MADTLVLLAALDLHDGRLGLRDRERIVDAPGDPDPLSEAAAWLDQGAQWLAVADLDALVGSGDNSTLVDHLVAAEARRAKIQVAGGIRSRAAVDHAHAIGAHTIVIDTAALTDPWLDAAFASGQGRVVAGLDVAHGRVYAPGSPVHGADVQATVSALKAAGCPGYLVTAVDREATRKGPDLDLVRTVCEVAGTPVGVAGGIAKLEHLHALATLTESGVVAAVLDAALYRDYFSVAEALAAVAPRFDPYRWGPAQPWGLTQGL